MAQSSELVDRVRDALAAEPSVREVPMFGGLSFMVNEAMVVSARRGGDLLVRSDPERADELLALEGASPAVMGTGRPMGKSWVSVDPGAVATDAALTFWMGVALDYNAKTARARPSQDGRSRILEVHEKGGGPPSE